VKFEVVSRVDRTDLYSAAKAFHQSVVKGTVEVRYQEEGEGATEAPSAAGF
jgi:hypothetical protein